MRRVFFFSAVLVMLGGLFFPPFQLQAAGNTCDCWCETEQGAVREPSDSDEKLTQTDCQARCSEKYPGYQMAVCASSPSQFPSQNVSCFNEQQCKDQNGRFDSKYQPPECANGSHYCYPDASKAIKTKLSTSIAGLTVTGDLGEYIGVVYKWMVGVATLVAIVIMMVGGFQWAFGGVSAAQIKSAQKRIMNGVIGLVLLLSSYLILFTINPQLLKLRVPEFPMIKQIALVSGKSCGYLTGMTDDSPYRYYNVSTGKGRYQIEDSSNEDKCGSVASVVKDDEGNEVADGTTCTWDTCPYPEEQKCFPLAGGRGHCLNCTLTYDNNGKVTPSSSLCGTLSQARAEGTRSRPAPGGGGTRTEKVPVIKDCFWTKDGSILKTSVSTPWTTEGTCAQLDIDCTQIKTCEDYDTVAKVYSGAGVHDLEAVRLHGSGPGILGSAGDKSLSTVCNEDPCKVSIPGYTRCYADELMSRFSGSWTSFVSLQGNDCNTLQLGEPD